MATKRNIKRYTLKDGKKFTNMKIEGPAVTKQSAERWEEDRLDTYRNNYQGKIPSIIKPRSDS